MIQRAMIKLFFRNEKDCILKTASRDIQDDARECEVFYIVPTDNSHILAPHPVQADLCN
jgi:hypothetical protein